MKRLNSTRETIHTLPDHTLKGARPAHPCNGLYPDVTKPERLFINTGRIRSGYTRCILPPQRPGHAHRVQIIRDDHIHTIQEESPLR